MGQVDYPIVNPTQIAIQDLKGVRLPTFPRGSSLESCAFRRHLGHGERGNLSTRALTASRQHPFGRTNTAESQYRLLLVWQSVAYRTPNLYSIRSTLGLWAI